MSGDKVIQNSATRQPRQDFGQFNYKSDIWNANAVEGREEDATDQKR